MSRYDLLKGVRVLDLTVALAGPFGTQIMADLGAEVIKVEAPVVGDGTRQTFPSMGKNDGYYFLALNRNKKSVAIDLQTPSGKEVFFKLVGASDVVISNLRVQAIRRLGITYEALSKINPGIIFCSLTAFGQKGPYAEYPGYDDVAQALSGISGLTTDEKGSIIWTAVGSGDIAAAVYSVIGILAALHKRKETGKGMEIDTCLLDAGMAFIPQMFQYYFVSGNIPVIGGSKHPAIGGFGFFKTSDGYVALGPSWPRIARVINKAELVEDERFKEPIARFLHKNELNAEIQEFFSKISTECITNLLRAEDIPAGPVLSLKQVEVDPQVLSNKMIGKVKDPNRGEFKVIECPIKIPQLTGEDHNPPPTLGQHTEEVLADILGYTREQIINVKAEAERHSEELLDKSVRRLI